MGFLETVYLGPPPRFPTITARGFRLVLSRG